MIADRPETSRAGAVRVRRRIRFRDDAFSGISAMGMQFPEKSCLAGRATCVDKKRREERGRERNVVVQFCSFSVVLVAEGCGRLRVLGYAAPIYESPSFPKRDGATRVQSSHSRADALLRIANGKIARTQHLLADVVIVEDGEIHAIPVDRASVAR